MWSCQAAIESTVNRSSLVKVKWPKINHNWMSTENSVQMNPVLATQTKWILRPPFICWTFSGWGKMLISIFIFLLRNGPCPYELLTAIAELGWFPTTDQLKNKNSNLWHQSDVTLGFLFTEKAKPKSNGNDSNTSTKQQRMLNYSTCWVYNKGPFGFLKKKHYSSRLPQNKYRDKIDCFGFGMHWYQASGARLDWPRLLKSQ